MYSLNSINFTHDGSSPELRVKLTLARYLKNNIGELDVEAEGDTASANYVLTTEFTTSGWCSAADYGPFI